MNGPIDPIADGMNPPERPRRGRWRRAIRIGILLLIGWLGLLSWQIIAAGSEASPRSADVAIVLGAAVYGDRPSPVFEERIRHGVDLYRSGRVRRLLFTGGSAGDGEAAESAVARQWAVSSGVPGTAILTEAESRTTLQNLVEAREVMRANGLSSALLVSDPLHMKRALRMCAGLDMDCAGSPTPTTRYRGLLAQADFLARELFFYHVYLVAGR